jgi:hypothetical protein
VPDRQRSVQFAQRHLHRDGFCGLIEEAAVDIADIRVANGAVKISHRRAVFEGLAARAISGGSNKELIPSV